MKKNTFNLEYFKAMVSEMNDYPTLWYVEGIVDQPVGDRQDEYTDDCPFDHTFIDQRSDGEDSYSGAQYFPIDDGQYIKVWFNC